MQGSNLHWTRSYRLMDEPSVEDEMNSKIELSVKQILAFSMSVVNQNTTTFLMGWSCCLSHFFLKKMGQPRPLFVYSCSFQTHFFTEKTADISGIGTRIVRVEGEHADHLTTTMARQGVV